VERRGAVRRGRPAAGAFPFQGPAHAYRQEIVPETRTVALPDPIDVDRVLAGTMRRAADGWWRATRTPDGPVTIHLQRRGDRVDAEAWGPGASIGLERVPGLLGLHDHPEDFDPSPHPLVGELHRRLPGLRLGRTGAISEAAFPVICEQKVTGLAARRSWRAATRRWGERAPGPAPLRLPPDPATLARLPYFELHRVGIERKRADTIRRVAREAPRLDAMADLEPVAVAARLESIIGVGPWTSAEVTAVALGDPDAVSVGDYHLPHQVTLALAGERVGSDERMLELLEPFRGHRQRVVRLILAAGIRRERRAPRYSPRDIAAL
jgi:3-methyladenine DNA glycosylase/8-oxoguanine DNA glycosylase